MYVLSMKRRVTESFSFFYPQVSLTPKEFAYTPRGECEIEKWRKFTSDNINYSVDNGKLLV